jgi:hypothetical protein
MELVRLYTHNKRLLNKRGKQEHETTRLGKTFGRKAERFHEKGKSTKTFSSIFGLSKTQKLH